jgi:hypothetical protein
MGLFSSSGSTAEDSMASAFACLVIAAVTGLSLIGVGLFFLGKALIAWAG